MSRTKLAPAAPILLVATTMLGTWLLSGVALDEAARFIAFEVLYVLLPGCLLYVLLSPAPGGWLRVLAIGWPCGYAIEVGAFAATAALHARGAFTLLPLAAAAAGAPFLISPRGRECLDALRRGATDRSNFSWRDDRRVEAMAVAVVLSAGLIVLALMTFASYPLPAHAHSVFYIPDNIDDISYAAEARHHWPLALPWVNGLSVHYYIAVFLHFAAINQVTGVPLPTVVLRLFPTMAIVVTALQLSYLGRFLGHSRWIAPTAVALLMIVQELNLDFTRPAAFSGQVFSAFAGSPTFALGVIFFLGLLALVQSWFTDADTTAALRRRPWAGSLPQGAVGLLVLLGVLVIGGGASKTSAIADFIGGLGLYWLWRLVRGGSSRLLSYGLVSSVGCFVAVYLLMLRGGNASNLLVHPLDFIHNSIFGPTFTAASGAPWPILTGHSLIWLVALLGAAAIMILCTLVPLLGAGWLLVRPRAISPFTLLSFVIFALSFLAYVMLSFPGSGEGYFLVYGYIALVPFAAKGLVELWQAIPQRKLALACTAVLVVGLAAGESSRAMSGSARASWYVWYAVAYGVVLGAVVIEVLNLRRSLTGAITSRAVGILACCVPLLVTLGLVQPLMQMTSRAWGTIFHERISLADSGDHQGMTTALYDGLIWVRDHTTPCAVLAVNNHYTFASHKSGTSSVDLFSHYAYYSAFTERRILLESWYVTPLGVTSNSPYPTLLALNDAAVVHGSSADLRELARDGVGYVLIDKTHGEGAPESASVSRLVFENSALRVYRLLTPSQTAGGVRRKCGIVTGI